MFAVIETGGKQYKVQNGDVIYVEKLAQEENSEVKFQVVALGGENGLKIGTPYVVPNVKWDTDNHILRLKFPLLMRNDSRTLFVGSFRQLNWLCDRRSCRIC